MQSRAGWFFGSSFSTLGWGFILLCFAESFRFGCVDVHEPNTKEVDIWSPNSPVRVVAPLPRESDWVEPDRRRDGRIFLRASAASYAWDASKERFNVIPSIPPPWLPPGVDKDQRIVYSSFGRLLTNPSNAFSIADAPSRLYDDGVREIAQIPKSERTLDFDERPRAIDMTDGGLLLFGKTPIGAITAYLLGPTATTWSAVPPLPELDPSFSFAAPDNKVALLDQPVARLWDPRTGTVAALAGPNPMRKGAAAVSIDEAHVLIAGGASSSKALTLRFIVECALAVLWVLLGPALAVRSVRKRRLAGDAALPYAVVGMVFALLPLGLVALAVEILIRIPLAGK